jgi:hypothetical protein
MDSLDSIYGPAVDSCAYGNEMKGYVNMHSRSLTRKFGHKVNLRVSSDFYVVLIVQQEMEYVGVLIRSHCVA